MKAVIIAIITAILFVAVPWGTQEANNNCILHDAQVAIWSIFGCHPDQFYSWRDSSK